MPYSRLKLCLIFIMSVAYRSVPRSLSARRTVFLPKIHRFSAKKVKSDNRTVFKIKTVLIDLFQKREPFRDYFKTNQF
jgi:hypothetical protein